MTSYWKDLLNSIQYTKRDALDIGRIKAVAELDYSLTEDVVDSLLIKEIITKEEYKELLGKLLERKKEEIGLLEQKRKDSEKEDFNPLFYYCCSLRSSFNGYHYNNGVINSEISDFYSWKAKTNDD